MLFGLILTGLTDVLLYGLVLGVLILITQIVWIPFWAAGVINGIGHWFGYRVSPTEDASTNMAPWGILIGGEELHNNHHAFPTAAKFSLKWYEFDIGWVYISILRALGMARVKHMAPVAQQGAPKAVLDQQTLSAVITNRYDVLSRYADAIKATWTEELAKLKQRSPREAERLYKLKHWLFSEERVLLARERELLESGLSNSPALLKLLAMRRELKALWGRSLESSDQLVARLQDGCRRAEESGIAPLAGFARQLKACA